MSAVTEKPRGRTTRKPARATVVRPAVVRNTAALPASGALSPAPPMGYRGKKPVRLIKAIGWKSPEAIAVLIASFFVSLACFYVAAYARVTAEGFEKIELVKELKAVKAERESLEASIAQLTRAEHITHKAQTLQLIRAPKAAIVQIGDGTSALSPAPSTLPTIEATEAVEAATSDKAQPAEATAEASPPTETLKPIVESVP